MPQSLATPIEPNPEIERPKVDRGPLEPPATNLHDARIRLLGIPFFGVVIPNATGLFGPIGPDSPFYWFGYAWFILLSGAVWQGNRFILVLQRRHYDWFDHPWRKVMLQLFAGIFYTAPLSVAMLSAWYAAAGFATIDWGAVRAATLVIVVCVIFVTHVYETVYLIQQRESDLVRVAELQRGRAEAELEALKSQVDPHFLFNSLNTLAHLIDHDANLAREFTEGLADVYRYILSIRERDLVPLADELAFVRAYAELLRLRFGESIRVSVEGEDTAGGALLPPISLQVLVENAVKHNRVVADDPLTLRIQVGADLVEVSNPFRARSTQRPSSGLGLRNLDERCRRLVGRGIERVVDDREFTVRVPIARTSA